jgi:hypothetical protein
MLHYRHLKILITFRFQGIRKQENPLDQCFNRSGAILVVEVTEIRKQLGDENEDDDDDDDNDDDDDDV